MTKVAGVLNVLESVDVGIVCCRRGTAEALLYDIAHELPNLKTIKARGWKMRQFSDFFSEVGAAFQFPSYFGENLDALDECLRDLDDISEERYVVLILESDQVLISEDVHERGALFRALKDLTKKPGLVRPYVLSHCESGQLDYVTSILRGEGINFSQVSA